MDEFRYGDILNLEYPNHEIERDFPDQVLRAAQFAPFAALTGYDETVEETSRFTEQRVELEPDAQEELNRVLNDVKAHSAEDIGYSITYFVPDEKKQGGRYVTVTDRIICIKEYEKILLTEHHGAISIPDIVMLKQVSQ